MSQHRMKRIAVAALAAAFGFHGLSTHAAYISTTGGDVLVAKLNEGDTINITATLRSNDPNENGEGEGLVFTGADFKIFNHNQPVALPGFTAFRPTLIYAHISNSDLEEVAQINFAINAPAGPNLFSPDIKAAAAHVASATNVVATTLAFVAALQAAGTITTGSAIATAIVSAGIGLISGLANEIAVDPVDMNYKNIATPVRTNMDLTRYPSSVAELIDTEEQAIALMRAITTAANRASGAFQDGDPYWVRQQGLAIERLDRRLSPLLPQLYTQLAAFGFDLATLGLNFSLYSPQDIYAIEDGISLFGVSDDLIGALIDLGATSDEITGVADLLPVQDTTLVARALNSGFQSAEFHSSLDSLSSALDTSPTVPEPQSLWLVLVALAMLVARVGRPAKAFGGLVEYAKS